jgi:hypothetical protein
MALGLAAATLGVEVRYTKQCAILTSQYLSGLTIVDCRQHHLPCYEEQSCQHQAYSRTSSQRSSNCISKQRRRWFHYVHSKRCCSSSQIHGWTQRPGSRTKEIPFKKILGYTKSLNANALHNSRIGIPRNGLRNPVGKTINKAFILDTFEKTISLLQEHGATIVDNANYPEYKNLYNKAPQGIAGPSEY